MPRRWLLVLAVAAVIPVSLDADCRKNIRVAPDQSRTVSAFMEAGVPAPDRVWTADDYYKFAEIVKKTADENVRLLPRFDSAASGPLMTRLVSPENFRGFRYKSLPLAERMIQTGSVVHALTTIINIYVEASKGNESFDRELAELWAFIIRMLVDVWALMDEGSEPPTSAQREAGEAISADLRELTSQLIQMSVKSLDETPYRPSEMRRLAASLETTLPSLLPYVRGGGYQQVVSTLRSAAAQNCDAETSATFARLLERVTRRASDAIPPAADDAAAYARYQTGIQQLAVGTTTPAAAAAQLGLPYGKYTFLEDARVTQEWVYPTGPREHTRLRFDVDSDKLTGVTKASFDTVVSFIHDGSPIMGDRDAARLDRLRAIRVGTPVSQLRAIERPVAELSEHFTSGRPESPWMSRKPAKGAWWLYTFGKLTMKFTVQAERVVEVSEILSWPPGKAPGALDARPASPATRPAVAAVMARTGWRVAGISNTSLFFVDAASVERSGDEVAFRMEQRSTRPLISGTGVSLEQVNADCVSRNWTAKSKIPHRQDGKDVIADYVNTMVAGAGTAYDHVLTAACTQAFPSGAVTDRARYAAAYFGASGSVRERLDAAARTQDGSAEPKP